MTETTAQHTEAGWAYRVRYDDLGDCGCGQSDQRLELVRQVLRDCPLYEDERWRAYDSPLAEWLLAIMAGADLIEHGSTLGGSWITEKGQRLLSALEDAAVWEALTEPNALVGYCECPECNPS